MKKINLTFIALVFSFISLSVSLVETTISRNALYLAFFISIACVIWKRSTLNNRTEIALVTSAFLFGACQYLYTILSEKSNLDFFIYDDYHQTSLRIMMSSFILYFVLSTRNVLTKRHIQIAKSLVVIGFIYTTCYALKLNNDSHSLRLEIKTVATMSAYIYAAEALCVAVIISSHKTLSRYIIHPFLFCLSYYIIILTQTRAVMLTFPFFYMAILYYSKVINLKMVLSLILFVGFSVALNTNHIENAVKRIHGSMIEINEYNKSETDTSLGARFSLWKAGSTAFIEHPLGQSVASRTQIAMNYIDTNEYGNLVAKRAVRYHFHNDLIEAASLRGILGIITFLLFILSLFMFSKKHTEQPLIMASLVIPTIVFGLVDTLFIDYRFVTIFMMLIVFYSTCYSRIKIDL